MALISGRQKLAISPSRNRAPSLLYLDAPTKHEYVRGKYVDMFCEIDTYTTYLDRCSSIYYLAYGQARQEGEYDASIRMRRTRTVVYVHT